jgi:hypothetical protein
VALAAQGAHPHGAPPVQPLADSRTPAGEPAPARAQAVPTPATAAQLARRERSQIRLRQKHLASKIWASVRIASRLLAWWDRAKALRNRDDSEGGTRECRARALDLRAVEDVKSLFLHNGSE